MCPVSTLRPIFMVSLKKIKKEKKNCFQFVADECKICKFGHKETGWRKWIDWHATTVPVQVFCPKISEVLEHS